MQHPDSIATIKFLSYSDSSEELTERGRHRPLSRRIGQYTIQTITDSRVAVDKTIVAISLVPHRVAKLPRVTDNTKFTARLSRTASQPEPGKQRVIDVNPFPLRIKRSIAFFM